jgi:hypothetical protein
MLVFSRQLGRKEEALSNYLMALHTYELASGKKSTSYVSTLANLGDVTFENCDLVAIHV